MISNKNTSKKYSVLLFLLWPFLALIFAIRNYKAFWAKDLLWFFVIFFGFTLTIHNYNAESTSDANRYKDKLIEMADKQVSFENVTSLFYDKESQVLDVLETIIIFVISRFTNNYHILFAVFGLIFGYFYSRNIWYLIEHAGIKIVRENIPIIFTFAFIVGFWQINGFRFWSASHIFLFGTLPYLFEGKKKYLGFSVLSVLMHFSYFLPLMVLGLHLLFGRRTNIYFVLFVLTFFVTELNLSQLGDFLSANLPEILLPRVKGYVNEDSLNATVEVYAKANWYVVWYQLALTWSSAGFLIVIFFSGKKFLKANKNFENIFSFSLLLSSVANIFSLIPSGGRFISLSNLFSLAFIFFYIQFAPRGKSIKRLIPFALPALILYCLVALDIGVEAMGVMCVVGNPLLGIFIDMDLTVIEVIKGALGF